MPRVLFTAKDLNTGAVTGTKRDFSKPTGKIREARVWFSFTAANVPYVMPHGLGRVPTSFQVAACGGADVYGAATLTAPGVIYSASALPAQGLNATKNVIVMACDTANSWAEIIVR
jgi:hypothetical protein